ncbi:MAG: Npt1/Npt2 family nucleotide transporter [Acidobacteriota bacterium]
MNRAKRAPFSRAALWMFLYFFLIALSIYIVKPVKESLFLDRLGKNRLPYAFLLTAVLMGLAVAVNSRLIRRVNRFFFVSLSLGFFILTGLIFWGLAVGSSPPRWVFLLLYSWGDVLMVTTITQFWILINDLFNPREVKRRIGFFVSGGLLGGIGGSLIARLGPGQLGTENLILLCPAVLTLCLAIILNRRRSRLTIPENDWVRPAKREEKVGFFQSLSLLRKNRYLLLLSGMIFVAIVVSNLVDFQFKSVAATAKADKNLMTSFFATFYLGVLVFSYLLSVLLTSRILKHFGMRFALLILPLLLLGGSLSLFLVPAGVAWAVLMKGADKSLTHSLAQSVRELLYIPVPQEIKYKAKVFIDMFLNKFADGLTGLLLIAFLPVLKDLSVENVSLVAVVFTGLWIALIFRVTREYVTIVKNHLHIKWRDADKLITEKIDVDVTKLVFDTLQSRERSSVLYAMNIFDLIKKENLSPEVKKLISCKCDEIRARSMDSLLDVSGECLLPEWDDSLDKETLDAQVKEIMALDVYQVVMREQIEKATREKGGRGEVSRMEAAKVIGMMDPQLPLTRELRKLLSDESLEVVRYAAESAGRLKKREFVPFLIRLLSRPATLEAAREALGAYGESILGTLKDVLSDPQEPAGVRQAVPGILARTGSQRAADILTLELAKENPEAETEVIAALHKMKLNSPGLRFSERIVLTKTVVLIKKCYLILLQLHDLKSDRKKEVLVSDAENNLSRTMKQVFELVGLIYPQEDITKAYQNILAGTKKALDYSLELLDNILKRELKELLLPLIEDTTLEEKTRLSRKMLKAAEKFVAS